MNVNDIEDYIELGVRIPKIVVPHQEKMIFESERELYRTETVCKSLGISNEEEKWGSFIPLRTILEIVAENYPNLPYHFRDEKGRRYKVTYSDWGDGNLECLEGDHLDTGYIFFINLKDELEELIKFYRPKSKDDTWTRYNRLLLYNGICPEDLGCLTKKEDLIQMIYDL